MDLKVCDLCGCAMKKEYNKLIIEHNIAERMQKTEGPFFNYVGKTMAPEEVYTKETCNNCTLIVVQIINEFNDFRKAEKKDFKKLLKTMIETKGGSE